MGLMARSMAALAVAFAAGCGGQLGSDGNEAVESLGNSASNVPYFQLSLVGVSSQLTQENFFSQHDNQALRKREMRSYLVSTTVR
jgi:hypothetical protein